MLFFGNSFGRKYCLRKARYNLDQSKGVGARENVECNVGLSTVKLKQKRDRHRMTVWP